METTKYTQKFRCYKCDNILEKDIEIVKDSKETHLSTFNYYCPHCNLQLSIEVKGKLVPNTTILRGLPKNDAL